MSGQKKATGRHVDYSEHPLLIRSKARVKSATTNHTAMILCQTAASVWREEQAANLLSGKPVVPEERAGWEVRESLRRDRERSVNGVMEVRRDAWGESLKDGSVGHDYVAREVRGEGSRHQHHNRQRLGMTLTRGSSRVNIGRSDETRLERVDNGIISMRLLREREAHDIMKNRKLTLTLTLTLTLV